jgi:hypothetical protein
MKSYRHTLRDRLRLFEDVERKEDSDWVKTCQMLTLSSAVKDEAGQKDL